MNRPCTDPHHVHRLIQPALTELTDRLRAGDRRITAPREGILNVLRQHALPLTNREIHRLLDDDCDLATVYRNLHTLAEMSLVNSFRLSVQPVKPAEWKEVCRMGGLK